MLDRSIPTRKALVQVFQVDDMFKNFVKNL
jgi:hypothetical protein